MTNFSHGRMAEDVAAAYLENSGYSVIDRNWRTRWCEIDIVAQKGKIIYFVEVKYRRSAGQGSGLDYITSKKQAQMEFAARLWSQLYDWPNDYRLSAVEVSGESYQVSAFLPEL
jgi:uncharacterized protein (TIGR00252 family)